MEWLIYLSCIAEKLSCFFMVMGTTIGIVSFIISLVFYLDNNFDQTKIPKLKKIFMVSMLFIFIGCLMPTQKQIACIYVIPKIIENKNVQQIPQKLLGLANSKLDEMIKETKEIPKQEAKK